MSAFHFDQHPVVFLRPRISHPYAWVGHIPFAYLLVDLLRPRRLVELGTDSGNSYLAFCQAITHLGAATEATAIDSWEGDPHARFYGEAVYATLSAYHDPRYGKFSRLMRGYFDDAVNKFKDGSIDLLHIDGLHTYEAVKHDFQTWLPKLSDRAVVIFHDSQVRERGFGVWEFIDELRGKHRCFDFRHSNGLAVVEIGTKAPSAFRDFMAHALAETEAVQSYFEAIAATIVDEKSGSPAQVGAERRNVECRVYYRNKNQQYDEQRSVTVSSEIDNGPADLVFKLPEGERPHFVRLDPADVPCVFGLRHLALSSADNRQRVLIKDEPARIRAISGELLPAKPPAWVRMMTFDSDPFVEISIEDVWSKFDKASPVTMEFGVEYESVISAPELIPLAHSSAESLQEFRANGQQQWGYPAIHRQVQTLHDEIRALDDSGASLNQHVGALAKHVDILTKNQSASANSLAERTDYLARRIDRASESQAGSADSLGQYVGQLAQHLDQLTRNQTGSMDSLTERTDDLARRIDRASESQAGSADSLGQYVGQLAQHLDQLTRNQTGSMDSLTERTDDLARRIDRASESQAHSADSLGQYVGQLAQHLDQLTRNQTGSMDSLTERTDDLARRIDRASESQAHSADSLGRYVGELAQHLDQLTRNQTGSVESMGQYIGQLASHLDQLTRNQLASIELQRAADARWHEQRQSLEDAQLRLRSSESRFEEIRRYQLLLSEQIDILTRQGVVQRIKRLLGR